MICLNPKLNDQSLTNSTHCFFSCFALDDLLTTRSTPLRFPSFTASNKTKLEFLIDDGRVAIAKSLETAPYTFDTYPQKENLTENLT